MRYEGAISLKYARIAAPDNSDCLFQTFFTREWNSLEWRTVIGSFWVCFVARNDMPIKKTPCRDLD